MVQVSCECLVLGFVTVILVVRPTLELVVRSQIKEVSERIEKISGEQEDLQHLAYRPTDRDKPSSDPSSTGENKLRMPKKPRRKRSSGSAKVDSFVFPDQVGSMSSGKKDQSLEDRLFVVPNTAGPPPCARGDTFCESVDEYPAEHVIRLLRKEPVFVRGFFQDERKQYGFADDVQDRIDVSDENPLCPAQEHTVYPKMAKNIEGNWLFVINQDEYIQGVRVEKCLNDRECSFPASLPIGYKSQCKQKYIYRKLVALNGTGQGVISDSFQFPSCCSCVIKLDHNLAHNRFAAGGTSGGGSVAALPLTLPKTTPTPLKGKTKN